jgi:hypothetical protein
MTLAASARAICVWVRAVLDRPVASSVSMAPAWVASRLRPARAAPRLAAVISPSSGSRPVMNALAAANGVVRFCGSP